MLSTSHKSRTVHIPIARVTNSPTSFTPDAKPIHKPVETSHIHQCLVNATFVKDRNFTQLKQAMTIKKIIGESNKMSLLCVVSALSKANMLEILEIFLFCF